MSVLHADIHDLGLLDAQMLLPLQGLLHDLLIAPSVGLRAQRVYGRALAAVEHSVLDAGAVCGLRHFAAQRVQLPDKMSLARPADGRVAGHIAHAVQIHGEAERVEPQPCRGQRGLDPGVTRADHGNVTASRLILYHIHSSLIENTWQYYTRFSAENNPISQIVAKTRF